MSNARDDRDRSGRIPGDGTPGVGSAAATEEIAWVHYSAGNLTAALEYFHDALQSPEIQAYPDRFRIFLSISDCHRLRGEFTETERFVLAARSSLPEDPLVEDLAKVEYREAYVQHSRGNYESSLKRAFRAYRRLKSSTEHREVAATQTLIGHCYLRLGMIPEAEDFFSDSISSFRRVDDKVGMAYAFNNLGVLHKNACRWQRALASFDRSQELAKSLGLSQQQLAVQLNMGVVYSKTRRFADAVSVLTAAVSSAERLGDQFRHVKGLLTLGRTYVLTGEFAKAERALVRAQAMATEYEYAREAALADEFIGELMMARRRLVEARVNFRRALGSARSFAPEGDIVAECLARLADVEYRLGRTRVALEIVEEGIKIAKGSEPFELGFLHRSQALCKSRLGDREGALSALEKSVGMFVKNDSPYQKARSIQALARLRMRSGNEEDRVRARQLLSEAIAGFGAVDETIDQIVCHVMTASIEQRLGNVDDALLAICEAERLVDEEQLDKFRPALRALRHKIENRMTRASSRVMDQFSVLGDIHNGARSRNELARGVGSTLELILEKLDADAGFVAIPSEAGRTLTVIARDGILAKEAQSVASWYARREDVAEPRESIMISDIESKSEFSDLCSRLGNGTGTVLLQGLGFDEESLGVLCVHQKADTQRGPLGQDALNFVAAYSSLISLSIFELLRNERREQRRARPSAPAKGLDQIVTENTGMLELLGLAERVAHSDATVMLQGETGTGKGLIAYAIHLLSNRRDREFVLVNCAALPEQLLESELFGHVRGAFTGAFSDKNGLLQQAHGGTVFLDEIGKTSPAMQGKLLQFLDNSKVRKVGSNDYTHVDVRVVCASKANLLGMVQEGTFLEDFFYRINDFPLHVPPLRERKEDIVLLMHHYVEKISALMDREVDGVSDAFVEKLKSYYWPGNVRELEKIVKRAIILSDDGDTLDVQHLAPEVLNDRKPSAGSVAEEVVTLRERIEKLEHAEIARALERSSGNKSRAAIQLGISYPNLLSKIKRYKLQ